MPTAHIPEQILILLVSNTICRWLRLASAAEVLAAAARVSSRHDPIAGASVCAQAGQWPLATGNRWRRQQVSNRRFLPARLRQPAAYLARARGERREAL